MLRLPFLLLSLSVAALLISCVPKAQESVETMADIQPCSLEIDLTTFDLISSTVEETTANYRVVLESPLRGLSAELKKQLEASGWEYASATQTSRNDNGYSARYTCAQEEKALQVSIKPVGRSLIHVVRLELE